MDRKSRDDVEFDDIKNVELFELEQLIQEKTTNSKLPADFKSGYRVLHIEEINNHHFFVSWWKGFSVIRLLIGIFSNFESITKLLDFQVLNSLIIRDLSRSKIRSKFVVFFDYSVIAAVLFFVLSVSSKNFVKHKNLDLREIVNTFYIKEKGDFVNRGFFSTEKKHPFSFISQTDISKNDLGISKKGIKFIVNDIISKSNFSKKEIKQIRRELRTKYNWDLALFFEFYNFFILKSRYVYWKNDFNYYLSINNNINFPQKQLEIYFYDTVLSFCKKILFDAGITVPTKQPLFQGNVADEKRILNYQNHIHYDNLINWITNLSEKDWKFFQNYVEFYIWEFYSHDDSLWMRDQEIVNHIRKIIKSEFYEIKTVFEDFYLKYDGDFDPIQNIFSNIIYSFSEYILNRSDEQEEFVENPSYQREAVFGTNKSEIKSSKSKKESVYRLLQEKLLGVKEFHELTEEDIYRLNWIKRSRQIVCWNFHIIESDTFKSLILKKYSIKGNFYSNIELDRNKFIVKGLFNTDQYSLISYYNRSMFVVSRSKEQQFGCSKNFQFSDFLRLFEIYKQKSFVSSSPLDPSVLLKSHNSNWSSMKYIYNSPNSTLMSLFSDYLYISESVLTQIKKLNLALTNPDRFAWSKDFFFTARLRRLWELKRSVTPIFPSKLSYKYFIRLNSTNSNLVYVYKLLYRISWHNGLKGLRGTINVLCNKVERFIKIPVRSKLRSTLRSKYSYFQNKNKLVFSTLKYISSLWKFLNILCIENICYFFYKFNNNNTKFNKNFNRKPFNFTNWPSLIADSLMDKSILIFAKYIIEYLDLCIIDLKEYFDMALFVYEHFIYYPFFCLIVNPDFYDFLEFVIAEVSENSHFLDLISDNLENNKSFFRLCVDLQTDKKNYIVLRVKDEVVQNVIQFTFTSIRWAFDSYSNWLTEQGWFYKNYQWMQDPSLFPRQVRKFLLLILYSLRYLVIDIIKSYLILYDKCIFTYPIDAMDFLFSVDFALPLSNIVGIFETSPDGLYFRIKDQYSYTPNTIIKTSFPSNQYFSEADTRGLFDYLSVPKFGYDKKLLFFVKKNNLQNYNPIYGDVLNYIDVTYDIRYPFLTLPKIKSFYFEKRNSFPITSQLVNKINIKKITDTYYRTLNKLYELFLLKQNITQVSTFTDSYVEHIFQISSRINGGISTLNDFDSEISESSSFLESVIFPSEVTLNSLTNEQLDVTNNNEKNFIFNSAYEKNLKNFPFLFKNIFDRVVELVDFETPRSLKINYYSVFEEKLLGLFKPKEEKVFFYKGDILSSLLSFYHRKNSSSINLKQLLENINIYKSIRQDRVFIKWSFFNKYKSWFFTFEWWEYFYSLLLETIPEIVLNFVDKLEYLYCDFCEYLNSQWNFLLNRLYLPLKYRKKYRKLADSTDKVIHFLIGIEGLLVEPVCQVKKDKYQKWVGLSFIDNSYVIYFSLGIFFILLYAISQEYILFLMGFNFMVLWKRFQIIKYLIDPLRLKYLHKLMESSPIRKEMITRDLVRVSIKNFITFGNNISFYLFRARDINHWMFVRKGSDSFRQDKILVVKAVLTNKSISRYGFYFNYNSNPLNINGLHEGAFRYLRYFVDSCRRDFPKSNKNSIKSLGNELFSAFQTTILAPTKFDSNSDFNVSAFELDTSLQFSDIPSRKILMVGPIETGRSFLIKAIAADSGFPLIRISMTELLNVKPDNESSTPIIILKKAVNILKMTFGLARRLSPCIIWIQDIHELNVNRFVNSLESDPKYLLCELVKILTDKSSKSPTKNNIVIAPTHTPTRIDPSLLLPERFQQVIYLCAVNVVQRQKEFPVLLRVKGLSLKNFLFYSDEFGYRTMGYNKRDLSVLANETSAISISRNQRNVCTNTIKLALLKQILVVTYLDDKSQLNPSYEMIAYRIGKAIIQKSLLNKFHLDFLAAGNRLLKSRFSFLSTWYLEPSITDSVIKELTLFAYISGCLAGVAARDAWFMLDNKREDFISLDPNVTNDLSLSFAVLESLLSEFTKLELIKNPFSKRGLSLESQDTLYMLQTGFFAESTLFGSKGGNYTSKLLVPLSRVWSPRTWRISHIRSSMYESIRTLSQNDFLANLIDFYRDQDQLPEQDSDFTRIKEGQKRNFKKPKFFVCLSSRKSMDEVEAKKIQALNDYLNNILLKDQFEKLGVSDLSTEYKTHYCPSSHPLFFLGKRFLWDTESLLFPKNNLLFAQNDLFITEELVRQFYVIRGVAREKERKRSNKKLKNIFLARGFSRNAITNLDINTDEEDKLEQKEKELEKEQVSIEQNSYLIRENEMMKISLQTPLLFNSSVVSNILFLEEFVDRFFMFNSVNHQQRWIDANNSSSKISLNYTILFEIYQYLLNFFLSNRKLLNVLIQKLIQNKYLLPEDIEKIMFFILNNNNLK
uniref:Ycf2 protein n=1 Tax=Equisetum ramosissimum TaxID=195849 RepID=UPI001FCDBDB6|nr:Ycf2 protein [Equisetum ramosissimum]UNI91847.1 Ycf2 protein [Equisetum ramosissimum]UVF34859.1 Ycf2 protein [Equisetum ramosissimum]